MRILFLSTWFPYPPDNGSKLRVYHLLRALARTHKVTLVSFAFDTARPDAAGDLPSLCDAIHVVPTDPFAANQTGVLRTYLSLSPIVSRPIPAMRQRVAEVLSLSRFDAAIASTEVMAAYAMMAGRGTVRILEEHNALSRWSKERLDGSHGLVQLARCWVSWRKSRLHEAQTYPAFDLVTMVSEVDRQATLDAVGTDRVCVVVVPNGVDCDRNRPGSVKSKRHALVYNGALTYSANYDAMQWFLADIYPRIRERVVDVSLTITGSTKGVDLAGLALQDSVHLTGYIEDVRPPVSQAAACVVPTRLGGGTRLKLLEAMALGTPVVATPKGAEGLDLVDGEHCLIANSPEAFAEKTVSLLQRADLQSELSVRARRLVEERYDWRPIGSRFASLVEETAERWRAKRGCTP